jgi:hypothetical protein
MPRQQALQQIAHAIYDAVLNFQPSPGRAQSHLNRFRN